MSQCDGVMGFIFGHKYIPVIVKSAAKNPNIEIDNISSSGMCDVIDKFRDETYGGLYCARCGETKNREGD